MSEHTWAAEQIAAAATGGLDAEETERLEAHARECPDCAAALAAARRLDRGLGSLFTAVQPGPALEDRAIRSLSVTRAKAALRSGWKRNLAWGLAASVGLGILGGGTIFIADHAGLPFPGLTSSPLARAQQRSTRGFAGLFVDNSELPDEVADQGVESNKSQRWNLGVAQSSIATAQDAEGMARELSDRVTKESGAQVTVRNSAEFSPPADGLPSGYYLEHKPEGKFRGEGDTYSPRGAGPSRSSAAGPVPEGFGMGMGAPADNQKAITDSTSNTLAFGETNGVEANLRGHYFVPSGAKPKLEVFAPPEVKNATPTMPSKMPEAGTPTYKLDSAANKGPSDGTPQKPSEVTTPAPVVAPPEAAPARKIIRNGDIEFEIESFDSAVATVTKLVGAIKGGFVATVNSEKLANGKVKGSIVVRVPPESLDSLVLDLRKELGKGGELKGQRIGSQDITKQYTDMESRLKAARTMETRLLQIIKEGKGEIKQLLEAEKELGNWRTKIEEYEGEKRYFDAQVALSTLTITLAEKEIRAAAGLTETERVQAGVEVEDVDKALQQALAAVTEAKGRVTKSELKQMAAGQFNAVLNFEVAPEQAGPLRDRLRQIGRVARLEIDRVQKAEGGEPQRDAKVKRGDTQFFVQLYNLANVAPRETATLQVAAVDVPTAYRELQNAVAKANGRVVASRLDEHDRQNVTAQLDFEVRRADEGQMQAALSAAGEVVSRNVTRAAEGDNVTDAKLLFRTSLTSAARLKPRETAKLAIEVADVDLTASAFATTVAEAKGHTVEANVAHERSGRVVAKLVYDVPLTAAPGVVEKLKSAGTVRVQETTRDPQASDGKFAIARIDVTLSNSDLIVPHDDGLWHQVRKGLSYSVNVLLFSVTWIIVGLCVVLPWALVGYGGYRAVRRLFFRAPPAT